MYNILSILFILKTCVLSAPVPSFLCVPPLKKCVNTWEVVTLLLAPFFGIDWFIVFYACFLLYRHDWHGLSCQRSLLFRWLCQHLCGWSQGSTCSNYTLYTVPSELVLGNGNNIPRGQLIIKSRAAWSRQFPWLTTKFLKGQSIEMVDLNFFPIQCLLLILPNNSSFSMFVRDLKPRGVNF